MTNPKRLGGGAGDGDGDEGDAFSLPRISGGGDGGRQRRRKPRHVSTFRERILEERRVRKEVSGRSREGANSTGIYTPTAPAPRRDPIDIHFFLQRTVLRTKQSINVLVDVDP